MYDSGFEAYRTVTSDEYRSVLRTGLIILDANVLLHLYRYHLGTRKDLMEILAAIKDHLWIPHQVMYEFWQGRSGVIEGRSTEIEEVISGLEGNGLRLSEGVIHWAKRIGLPESEKAEILDRLESAVSYAAGRVRKLSTVDDTENASDTNRDPVLAALEPILHESVGRPLEPGVAREAKKEALQRIADKRAPGWRDASKKENKEGDYFVWYQSLQEAKRRELDVLFVTDDVKPDWWRIERGETKGPLPELVQEMREIANVRLFMTRPETLLLHAEDVIGKSVSSDSIRDVQRVSSQVDAWWNAESLHARVSAYTHAISAAISELGYQVIHNAGVSDQGFDFIVRNSDDSRVVFVELKLNSSSISRSTVDQAIGMSSRLPSPVLLIINTRLTRAAKAALQGAEDLTVVVWNDDSDTPQLAAALEQIFA